jgi:hypothetical protein
VDRARPQDRGKAGRHSMRLADLVQTATNKANFTKISDYTDFCKRYLEFVAYDSNLQAIIVCQNETAYRFFQYKEEGHYNITRPLNANLMYDAEEFLNVEKTFVRCLALCREISLQDKESRSFL